MKKNLSQKKYATVIIACIGLMLSAGSFAAIKYEYDDAGNRKRRYNPDVPMYAKKANADEQTTDIFEEELPEMKISITPNPTRGFLQVEISNAETLQGAEIRLYSPQGMLIRKINNLSETTTLDISNQPGGIYIMQIVLNNKEISTWKIIKN